MTRVADFIKQWTQDVPDYPKAGIVFKDLNPVLRHPDGLRTITSEFSGLLAKEASSPVQIAAIEARGFIYGSALAAKNGYGLTLLRKPKKLPPPVTSWSYDLEYGQDQLEVQPIVKGTKFVLVDDVLATGGTAQAAYNLIKQGGGEVVAMLFVMELAFLNARPKLLDLGIPVHALSVVEG